MSQYPDRHHPCFFLEDALNKLGATAQVVRDDRTLGCWGLIVNGKRMVWLIDNRHPHEAEKEDPAAKRLLSEGILVCHAQKPDMDRVGGKWLPLAVTPGYRLPDKPVEKIYDVGFVGYVRDLARADVLCHVARHFNLCVAQGQFGDAAVSVYWQSEVGLNVVTNYGAPNAYDSANIRCFEILATGTPLVTPYEDYLVDLGLADEANCLAYQNADELLDCIDIATHADNGKIGRRIGAAGAALAQDRHTYTHRAKQVLEWLE